MQRRHANWQQGIFMCEDETGSARSPAEHGSSCYQQTLHWFLFHFLKSMECWVEYSFLLKFPLSTLACTLFQFFYYTFSGGSCAPSAHWIWSCSSVVWPCVCIRVEYFPLRTWWVQSGGLVHPFLSQTPCCLLLTGGARFPCYFCHWQVLLLFEENKIQRWSNQWRKQDSTWWNLDVEMWKLSLPH